MGKNSSSPERCVICGKDFRITMKPEKDLVAPELVIENNKEKWICPECRKSNN